MFALAFDVEFEVKCNQPGLHYACGCLERSLCLEFSSDFMWSVHHHCDRRVRKTCCWDVVHAEKVSFFVAEGQALFLRAD